MPIGAGFLLSGPFLATCYLGTFCNYFELLGSAGHFSMSRWRLFSGGAFAGRCTLCLPFFLCLCSTQCASAGGDCFAVQDNLHWAYGLLMSVHYGGHAKNSPGFDKDEQESEISEIAFLWFNLFNDDFLCPQSPGSTSRRVPAVWGHLGFHSCEKRWLCSDLG